MSKDAFEVVCTLYDESKTIFAEITSKTLRSGEKRFSVSFQREFVKVDNGERRVSRTVWLQRPHLLKLQMLLPWVLERMEEEEGKAQVAAVRGHKPVDG